MEVLGHVGHVESHFDPFVHGVSVGSKLVRGLCQTYHRLRNHLGRSRWYSKVTRIKWKLDSVRLEIVLILTQDRCTVCVEHTMSSEVVLDAPDGTPR